MFIRKVIPENLDKKRIDHILKELELVESRNQALALIISGKVFIDNEKVLKPGKIVRCNKTIELKKEKNHWVSRGGVKLNHALNKFDIIVSKKITLDIGCSTGGFTDVLLKNGVKKVYAVDVGYGQLDWRLRNSGKVVLFERTNARNLNRNIIPESLDLVVCDVSFISLKKVLLPVKNLLNRKFEILSLIKPQFEAKKTEVGRGGIIKDSRIHNRICEELISWFKQNFDYEYLNIIDSPIKGQKGNKEFFIYIKN